MSNPLIFLDVDGVLNIQGGRILIDLLDNLRSIVDQTGADIVISSTWRLNPDHLNDLKSCLDFVDLKTIGETPDLSCKLENGLYTATERGLEIQQWMTDNYTPDKFVILDDNSDMAHLKPHLIQTDPNEGLTTERAEAAIALLR